MSKKIKIMTDSASDILVQDEQKLDIQILPFSVTIGKESYLERIDFNPQEFYNMLEAAPTIPTTAQVTAIVFCGEFLKLWQQGYTEVIYVSINAKGSGTYNAALLGRKMLYEENPSAKEQINIHILDSGSYSLGYGCAVVEAARKVQKGVGVGEILAYLEDWIHSVQVYFVPFTLEYAKKSGRISCAAAFVGELLGLKPVIMIVDGEMKIVEKVRGEKAAMNALLKYVKANIVPQTPYYAVTSAIEHECAEVTGMLTKLLGYEPEAIYSIGASIAINSGPRVIGVAIKGKNRLQ